MAGLSQYSVYYFIGIGGIGMSALARYFHRQGHTVLGYDRTSTALTTELELEGIAVHFEDTVLAIPQLVKVTSREKVLVVYTPAIPRDSAELNWFLGSGYDMRKRSEVLGLITESSRTIAVAGTHGKTTTSTLITHLLLSAGIPCNAFLGGISSNYKTNLVLTPEAVWTVVEADEYDRSFLTLTPQISVITSMDADHLDIYGSHAYMVESFNLFARRTREGGELICRMDLPLDREGLGCTVISYGMGGGAQCFASDVRIKDGAYSFNLVYNLGERGHWELKDLELGMPGRHNVENAVAACAAALEAGLTGDQLRSGLSGFKGVFRRFDYVIRRPDRVLIDDYAHHPEELRACISSVREMYPDRRITGVFQPHLFSRTRDFLDDFAVSLALLDEVILLPIYPAREQPIPGIDSQLLLDKIPGVAKKLVEKSELLDELKSRHPDVVLMLGAGDIDALVEPVRRVLEQP